MGLPLYQHESELMASVLRSQMSEGVSMGSPGAASHAVVCMKRLKSISILCVLNHQSYKNQ